MHRFKITMHFSRGRLLNSTLWIFGLIFGCYLALQLPDRSIIFISHIYKHQLSVAALFVSLSIPLVLSFLAFKLHLKTLIFLVTFFKGVCFSFCALCLLFAFGDAGWLVYRFYLFSDSCSVIILNWFWNHYFNEEIATLKKGFTCCSLAILAICFIDFLLVSPFVKTLFDN